MKIIKVLGGLGNQMFQMAFALAIKNKVNNDIKIDTLNFENYELHNGYEIERIFGKLLDRCKLSERNKISYSGSSLTQTIKRKFLKQHKLEYIQSDFGFIDYNILLKYKFYDGYWQSEKYFKAIEDRILEKFTFPDFVNEKNIELKEMILASNSISLHVRRGDYVNNPIHGGICNLEYYQEAIQIMKSKIKNPYFVVFSNDIEWCKENLDIKNVVFVNWNKSKNSYRDMQLMSLCKHNIIANSSFSWWGAWLNKNSNKIIVAPKKWFNGNENAQDIIPRGWIKI